VVSLNESVRRLLDEPNVAVLATINADGSPQTSAVWVGREGEELVISSARGRRKDRNIGRDPRVSLSVFDRNNPEQYAEIRGVATVTEDAGRALAIRMGEAYNGPGGGQMFIDLPPEVIRVVIRIVPDHVAGHVALPASPRPQAGADELAYLVAGQFADLEDLLGALVGGPAGRGPTRLARLRQASRDRGAPPRP